jgi:hypothetical protein
MAKYGLFGGNLQDPMQTFEGDSMAQDKEYVYIYQTVPGRVGRGSQVAAVKLGDGQAVKLISK